MFSTPASLLFRLRKPEAIAAWDHFVELYTPLLYHWAQRLELQPSDSADLVQEVFLILWRKLPEFEYDSGKSFHAWLKTIFLNRYRTRLRERGSISLDMERHDCIDRVDEQLLDVEESHYLIRQVLRLIEKEFSVLHQQVFKAYVLDQRTPEDVAAEFNISPGTVYGVKSKILSRLRQEVENFLE